MIASIFPSRISVRVEPPRKSIYDHWAAQLCREATTSKNLKIKKSSWKLSYQSKKKFLDTCQFLQACSKPRTIQLKNKAIYNFQTSFITLTLPVAQSHTDLELKKCLNYFLTQLRRKFGLQNYVWKAELQKNESIHFHLIIDQYIHHKAIRYYWNQAIETLGYVSAYREKFSKMSLQQYAVSREIPVAQAFSAFRKGVESNWSSPPTEQIKAARSASNLAGYLAKYIIKPVQDQEENITDEEIKRIQSFGRVWARSQSLSSIVYQCRYDWESLREFLGSSLESMERKIYDWCTVFYVSKATKPRLLGWLRQKMIELGITFSYPFPVPVG